MTTRRRGAAAWVLVVAAWAAPAGCGDGFVAPPPPELAALPRAGALPSVETIQLIVAAPRTPDRETWVNTAMQEAARSKAILRVERPEPGDPPARQAELIRKAIARAVDAVIVEPVDAPEVAAALAEARGRGIPVVLLRRRVDLGGAPSADAAPTAFVDFEPFEPAVRTLAEALRRDADGAGIPADAHALLAVNDGYEGEADDQVAALIGALRDAGFATVEPVHFRGEYTNGRDALLARLEADPKAQVLVAHDERGLSALLDAYARTKGKRVLSVAGILSVDRAIDPNVFTQCAAIADRSEPNLIREAVRLALAMAKGDRAADGTERLVPITFSGVAVGNLPRIRPGERIPPPVRPDR